MAFADYLYLDFQNYQVLYPKTKFWPSETETKLCVMEVPAILINEGYTQRQYLFAERGCLPCLPLKIKKSVLVWGENVLIVFHYELKLSIKIAIFQKTFHDLGNPWLSPWWGHLTNVGPNKTEMWRKYTEYKNENQLLEPKCLQIDSGFQLLNKKTF